VSTRILIKRNISDVGAVVPELPQQEDAIDDSENLHQEVWAHVHAQPANKESATVTRLGFSCSEYNIARLFVQYIHSVRTILLH
jgi:hypothetical protein